MSGLRFLKINNHYLIGDTHFGRKFKEGVPLDRRGEYEELIYKDFEYFVLDDNHNNIIFLGDLFDNPDVGVDCLYRVYSILSEVPDKNNIYIIAGNHDLPKDITKKSSIEILEQMLRHKNNIKFIIKESYKTTDDILLVPYGQDFTPCGEMICGHFEKEELNIFIDFDKPVYSGHYHHPEWCGKCYYVGSFYPLNFGEESDDSIMVTITLDDLESMRDELKNKRVRILLKKDESLPENLDCMQLVSKRINEEEKNINLQIDIVTDFDIKSIFFACLQYTKRMNELWLKYLRNKSC